eukprot:TRINITY_DN14516_c0_g1_i1.p1 TRINITY_DN14516_c0_g1~~TRINITY_DN14516_c0_g1_i1.p1  ORF type:complete len:906 (+),score=185.07 TRINITY_DN14516_c0_g1_i1:79-2796(+)
MWLTGHTDDVLCITVNKSKIISGSEDSTIRIWDCDTGKCISVLEGHSDAICSLLMLNDATLISGSADGTIREWNVNTFEHIGTYAGHKSTVYCLAVVGASIYSGAGTGDCTIRQWNTKAKTCVWKLAGHSDGVTCLQVKGQYLFSGSDDGTIRQWNTKTNQCVRIVHSKPIGISSMVVSKDSLFAARNDGAILHYGITGTTPGQVTSKPNVNSELDVQVLRATSNTMESSDVLSLQVYYGTLYAGMRDGLICCYNIDQRKVTHLLRGHSGAVRALFMNGTTLISGSSDKLLRQWTSPTVATNDFAESDSLRKQSSLQSVTGPVRKPWEGRRPSVVTGTVATTAAPASPHSVASAPMLMQRSQSAGRMRTTTPPNMLLDNSSSISGGSTPPRSRTPSRVNELISQETGRDVPQRQRRTSIGTKDVADGLMLPSDARSVLSGTSGGSDVAHYAGSGGSVLAVGAVTRATVKRQERRMSAVMSGKVFSAAATPIASEAFETVTRLQIRLSECESQISDLQVQLINQKAKSEELEDALGRSKRTIERQSEIIQHARERSIAQPSAQQLAVATPPHVKSSTIVDVQQRETDVAFLRATVDQLRHENLALTERLDSAKEQAYLQAEKMVAEAVAAERGLRARAERDKQMVLESIDKMKAEVEMHIRQKLMAVYGDLTGQQHPRVADIPLQSDDERQDTPVMSPATQRTVQALVEKRSAEFEQREHEYQQQLIKSEEAYMQLQQQMIDVVGKFKEVTTAAGQLATLKSEFEERLREEQRRVDETNDDKERLIAHVKEIELECARLRGELGLNSVAGSERRNSLTRIMVPTSPTASPSSTAALRKQHQHSGGAGSIMHAVLPVPASPVSLGSQQFGGQEFETSLPSRRRESVPYANDIIADADQTDSGSEIDE